MKISDTGLILFIIIGIFSCRPEPSLTESDLGDINASKLIVVGDSYIAGYQDGALYRDGQSRSVGALLSRQIEEVRVSKGEIKNGFNQILMPDNDGLGINSKPWDFIYTGAGKMGDRTDCKGEMSIGPVKNPYLAGEESFYLTSVNQNDLNDFSFPFMHLSDMVSTDFETRNIYYNKIHSALNTNTPLEAIEAQDPTFFAAWLGMEDVYHFAREGGYNSSLMSGNNFRNYLDTVISNITSNGAKGVIATIPDFRYFPAFTLIPPNGAELTLSKADSLNDIYATSGLSHIQFQEGANYFVMDDTSHSSGYRQMQAGEYLTLTIPLDSMKCEFYGILFTAIHNRYVLDSTEVTMLDDAIDNYNAAIREVAQTYNLAVFESEWFYANLLSGIKWNGVDYDAEFVSGGFYSLDGFHPNQKGHVLLTNGFIEAINQKYNAAIPPVNCPDCNGILFH